MPTLEPSVLPVGTFVPASAEEPSSWWVWVGKLVHGEGYILNASRCSNHVGADSVAALVDWNAALQIGKGERALAIPPYVVPIRLNSVLFSAIDWSAPLQVAS